MDAAFLCCACLQVSVTIEDGAFEGLNALQTLSLSQNGLTRISAGMLRGMPGLKTLALYVSNSISTEGGGV